MTSAVEGGPVAPVAPALREIADLPGPRGLPWLGSMLEIDKPHIHAQIEGWARRYGDLFTFRLGGSTILVVADHRALGAMLRDRPDGFRRTPRFAQIAGEIGLAAGVFGAEGQTWARQRRMVMAGFDPRQLRAYFPQLVAVCRRLSGRWEQAAAGGRDVDLQGDLMRFTVDAVAGLAFGSEVNTLESDADVIQRHLDKIFPALHRRLLSPLPTWRWWRSKADRALDASVAEVNVAIDGFVRAARERLAADAERRARPRNLLEAMIVAADDPDSGITDREVSGNVMTMLLAGEDTTANTLAWATWLLFTHPQALRRARDEVDAVAGDIGEWTLERFAALPWLEACANETMRLKPVAPAITLLSLRDTVVGDVRVPARTVLYGALRSDSLKAEHFAEAGRFDPARWLEQAVPSASSAHRVAMPFGAGPRVCPGRHLAMLEIKLALATLLRGFEIERVSTAGGGEPDERMSFTMAPEPLTMRLRLRAPASA